MNNTIQSTDILAFGAHPDDVEIGCGGLLIKSSKKGYKTVIVDFSQSELSSNGTVEIRREESEKARIVLGAEVRENLYVADSDFQSSPDICHSVVHLIRKYRPKMVLLPYYEDRHPDHEAASKVVKQAIFKSGLIKYETQQIHYRPHYVFMYSIWTEFEPSLIVDISSEWAAKKQAILLYETQFKPNLNSVQTILNNDKTMDFMEARAKIYGFKIGKNYGEAYISSNPVGIDDPFTVLPNFF